jgi:hypothetical protein
MAFWWYPNKAARTLYGAGPEHGGQGGRGRLDGVVTVMVSGGDYERKAEKEREKRTAGVGVAVASKEWAEGRMERQWVPGGNHDLKKR